MSGRPIRKSAGERTNSAQAAATSMLLPLIECHVLHAVSAHALSEQELAQHLVDRGYKIRHPELRELLVGLSTKGWVKLARNTRDSKAPLYRTTVAGTKVMQQRDRQLLQLARVLLGKEQLRGGSKS